MCEIWSLAFAGVVGIIFAAKEDSEISSAKSTLVGDLTANSSLSIILWKSKSIANSILWLQDGFKR